MVDLVQIGVVVILAGFGILVASMVAERSKNGGRVHGGGIVLIGPIPIIFGSNARWATVAIALAIVLILLTIVLGVF